MSSETMLDIPFVSVVSTNVMAIGYVDQILAVRFHGGRTYYYAAVPADIHVALMAAESKGQFVAKRIRGVFECVHVAPPKTT